MPRKSFPSDQRRWFRLESPQLSDDTANLTDAEFRAFVLILAWANETKAQIRDDWVYIAKNRLPSVAPNKRGSVASSARVVRELCAKQTWQLLEHDGKWSIQIRNWTQKQGFPPAAFRRNSVGIPTTTTTPTTTPTPTPPQSPPRADARPVCGKKPTKRKPGIPFPEDTAELRAGLDRWAADKPQFSGLDLEECIATVADWAGSHDHRRASWLAVCQNGIRNGWAAKFKPGGGGGNGPGNGKDLKPTEQGPDESWDDYCSRMLAYSEERSGKIQ